MTKKEKAMLLTEELKKHMEIQAGGIGISIVNHVYQEKYQFKKFLIYKDEDGLYDYESFCHTDWEIETQERYFNKRNVLRKYNTLIEVCFEKNTYKGLTVIKK